MTTFNLLLLVLVLVFSTECMADDNSSQTEYDELLLVLQWPTSFCNKQTIYKCDGPIPDKFTVHGLWLNKNSKGVNCPTSNSPIQISGDLRKEMEEYWPDLKSQEHPESFWGHEYEKHGSCIKEFNNHVDYFETALAIAKEIGDVMTMRLSSGETLTKGQLYDVQDFEPVTIASRQLTPQLRCSKPSGSKNPQLLEIVFCTERNVTLKNCTSKDVCGGLFEFPQVPASSSSSSHLLGYEPFKSYYIMLYMTLCMILCCN